MAKKPDDKSKGKETETKEGKAGTDPSAGKQAGSGSSSGSRQGKPSDERSAGKKAPRSS